MDFFEVLVIFAIGLMAISFIYLMQMSQEDERKEKEHRENIKRLEEILRKSLRFQRLPIHEKTDEDGRTVFYFNYQKSPVEFYLDQNEGGQNCLVVDITYQLTRISFTIINDAEIELSVKHAFHYITCTIE